MLAESVADCIFLRICRGKGVDGGFAGNGKGVDVVADYSSQREARARSPIEANASRTVDQLFLPHLFSQLSLPP
jgi:hypothetical protein